MTILGTFGPKSFGAKKLEAEKFENLEALQFEAENFGTEEFRYAMAAKNFTEKIHLRADKFVAEKFDHLGNLEPKNIELNIFQKDHF